MVEDGNHYILWETAKDIRRNFLSKNDDFECQPDGTLLSDQHITENIDIIESKLQDQQNVTLFENITQETLQLGAELYTYHIGINKYH